jgi:hypothetical protein
MAVDHRGRLAILLVVRLCRSRCRRRPRREKVWDLDDRLGRALHLFVRLDLGARDLDLDRRDRDSQERECGARSVGSCDQVLILDLLCAT